MSGDLNRVQLVSILLASDLFSRQSLDGMMYRIPCSTMQWPKNFYGFASSCLARGNIAHLVPKDVRHSHFKFLVRERKVEMMEEWIESFPDEDFQSSINGVIDEVVDTGAIEILLRAKKLFIPRLLDRTRPELKKVYFASRPARYKTEKYCKCVLLRSWV